MIKKLFICEKKKKLEAVNPQQNGWDSSKLYEENINPFNYYDKCFINICQVSLYLFTVLQVNEIRTIHDRILIARNGTDLINKWTADGLCKYIDEKKYPIEAKQPEYTSHKSRLSWINWINQGKMLYGNKEKIQSVINQQRINLAEVEYLELDSIENIIQSFHNVNEIFTEDFSEYAGRIVVAQPASFCSFCYTVPCRYGRKERFTRKRICIARTW